MTTYTLTTPITLGTLANPVTVSSLELTTLQYTSTPALAPIGTGTLAVTLTDPKTGAQESIAYQDASVLALWQTIGDTIAQAIFAKLIADGKLPAGTLATVADTPETPSINSSATDTTATTTATTLPTPVVAADTTAAATTTVAPTTSTTAAS